MTEPSNAELVRRIEELVRSVERLALTMENTYSTKEAVTALRELHGTKIKELEKDNESAAAFRRQITAACIVLFLGTLFSLIIALGPNVGAP